MVGKTNGVFLGKIPILAQECRVKGNIVNDVWMELKKHKSLLARFGQDLKIWLDAP